MESEVLPYRAARPFGQHRRQPRTAVRLAALLLCLIAGAVGAEERDGYEWAQPQAEPAATGPTTAYVPALEGVEDAGLRDILEASSQLFGLVARPPATLSGLERRAEEDLERLQTALRSEGYYAAEAKYRIEEAEGTLDVTLEVTPGPRYSLAAYEIGYEDPDAVATGSRPRLQEIGIDLGMPARAPEIVAAERKLVSLLTERGHPFARVADRKSVVNHEAREMTVRLSVSAGRLARFGPLTVEGLQEVEEDYLRVLVDWSENEVYDRRKVDSTRRNLSGTELFESVAIGSAESPDEDGRVPMTATLVESKHRSIGAGLFYSTDIGPGGEVFWEHRNILGKNESLRLSATGSPVEQLGNAAFRKPSFWERDQNLLANASGGNRNTDAFDQLFAEGYLGLERPWLENWQLSAGAAPAYSILDETDREDERKLAILGFPLTGVRDDSNDALNPTAGTRLRLTLTPTLGAGSDQLLFLKATVGGTAYYSLDSAERFVLAGRARVGSIVGERTEAVPADRRFYAGGGGSIRGYEFQRVGPLDDDDDPLGGRSLLEVGGEVRIRLTEDIGVVPFVDGGTVFDPPYPDFNETFRWAAGLGFRYFTGFGPLRLDVALPLNPRDDVDDDFQFYVSFGQAF